MDPRNPRARDERLLRRYTIGLGGFVTVWWVLAVSGAVPRILFPAPPEVLAAAFRLHERGVLLPWLGLSLLRVSAGFAVAAALGVVTGIVLGTSARLREYVEPIVETIRPIPPVAWIPLILAWMGPTLAFQPSIIGLAVFFPTLINTCSGVTSVDRTMIWVALTMGATRKRVFLDVMLPGAMPSILSGVKIGMGTGLMTLVAAEMIGSRGGLGFLIISYYQVANDLPAVMVGMALLSVIGLTAYRCFLRLERRLLRWVPEIR